MYSDRKALAFSAIPFALVSLATLALFFAADQTLDALRVSMRFSDLWMEADRGASLQLLRCIDHGGIECDLVEQRLQRPLAYVLATRERAKPNPDNQIIKQELEKAGITASLLRFRLKWFEGVARFAGLAAQSSEEAQNQESRLKGELPPDLRAILELDQRAKSAWAKPQPDTAALAVLRTKVEAFSSSLERSKAQFDARSIEASLRLRRTLYLVVVSCVLAMFGIATWSSQRMLQRWRKEESVFLEREKQLSRELARHVEELRQAVADKNVLLREVQHRVKNNLAVIAALLGMEADRSGGHAGEALMTTRDRVHSMALVHDRLCHAGAAAHIDFGEYIEVLSRDLLSAFGAEQRGIHLHTGVDVWLPLDQAVPCGLIVNELLTNSLKHAFPNGRSGNIRLSLKQDEEAQMHLRYSDDGIGLPKDFAFATCHSLGIQIISDLAAQVDGQFEREGVTGAAFHIRFASQPLKPNPLSNKLSAIA